MKLKRTMIATITTLMIGASLMNVNASDTTAPVPTLISIQQEEVQATLVSYENGKLTVTVDEVEVTISVDPDGQVEEVKEVTESTYGPQFSKLQPGTMLDMLVTEGLETTYILEELLAIHQVYNGGSDLPMLIKETIMNEQFAGGFDMVFEEVLVTSDVNPQVIDKKVMVPLRAIAEALGYEVSWNSETKAVELINGPQFTSITIGNNQYFRNKMAPSPLSAPPVIVDSRTLVPVEFVTEILGYGIAFEDGIMTIYNESFTTLTGYVSSIEVQEDYNKVYVAPRLGDDVEMWEQTVLIVSDQTVINREMYEVGDLINGVHMPVMTMSIPGQTSAVIIY